LVKRANEGFEQELDNKAREGRSRKFRQRIGLEPTPLTYTQKRILGHVEPSDTPLAKRLRGERTDEPSDFERRLIGQPTPLPRWLKVV
jgi:hypothetical protein